MRGQGRCTHLVECVQRARPDVMGMGLRQEKHNIKELMQTLMTQVVTLQPKDPTQYLVDVLSFDNTADAVQDKHGLSAYRQRKLLEVFKGMDKVRLPKPYSCCSLLWEGKGKRESCLHLKPQLHSYLPPRNWSKPSSSSQSGQGKQVIYSNVYSLLIALVPPTSEWSIWLRLAPSRGLSPIRFYPLLPS